MVKIWRIGFDDRRNVVMAVVAAGARIGGEGKGMREVDKDDTQNFNFRNCKSGVNINQKEGTRLWQAQVLGKDQYFGFGCAKFGATIRPPAEVVRWEVGGGSGVHERGLGWGHGASKKALTLLCDCSPIPFPLWASVFPWTNKVAGFDAV